MPLACATTVILGYVPYCVTYSVPGALGFLPMYTAEEGLQSGDRFYLLNMLPSAWMYAHHVPAYKVFVALAALGFRAGGGVGVLETRRRRIQRGAAVCVHRGDVPGGAFPGDPVVHDLARAVPVPAAESVAVVLDDGVRAGALLQLVARQRGRDFSCKIRRSSCPRLGYGWRARRCAGTGRECGRSLQHGL